MRSAETTVVVPTDGGSIVPQSTDRLAIIFPSVKGARYTVSTLPGPVLGQGIDMQSGTQALMLTRSLHGELVSRQWFGIAETNPVTINYIEVFP